MSGAAATASGRPLRFVGLVLALWISARILAHYPFLPDATKLSTSPAASVPNARTRISSAFKLRTKWTRAPVRARGSASARIMPQTGMRSETKEGPHPALPTYESPALRLATSRATYAARDIAPLPLATPPGIRRWQASAWIFWRERGGGNTLASRGRLGGSQAGLRIDRHLMATPLGTLAGYARASAALEKPHAGEVALGAVLHPATGLPTGIGFERRVAVQNGGRNAFAIIATTGIGPQEISPHWLIEGYAQGGIVGLRSRDSFVDGRIALTRSVPQTPLAIGVSISGGAQPHVARLDAGPVVEIHLPINPIRPRLILEWRERIVGSARPGSGPSVTLASDF